MLFNDALKKSRHLLLRLRTSYVSLCLFVSVCLFPLSNSVCVCVCVCRLLQRGAEPILGHDPRPTRRRRRRHVIARLDDRREDLCSRLGTQRTVLERHARVVRLVRLLEGVHHQVQTGGQRGQQPRGELHRVREAFVDHEALVLLALGDEGQDGLEQPQLHLGVLGAQRRMGRLQ